MDSNLNDLFAPYDDVAVRVVSDTTVHEDVRMSNVDMVEYACRTLGVDSFDLFEEHNFADEVEKQDRDRCLAYAFIAYLRLQVFDIMRQSGEGTPAFSELAYAHSELWYMRLVAAWAGAEPTIVVQ